MAAQKTISKKFQGIFENFAMKLNKYKINKIPVTNIPVTDTTWIHTEDAGVKIKFLKG